MPTETPRGPSDGDLVRAALSGEREAFRALVERHGTLVLAYLVRQTRSASAAEDLAQEVFLTAYQDLARLRNPDTLRAWLLGIARNKVREWRRGTREDADVSRGESPLDAADATPGPGDRAAANEALAVVTDIVNGMGPRYKMVVWMRLVDEMSFREISERLGMKEGTVRMRFSRGAAMLRKTLRRRGVGTDRIGGTRDV
jgi:RNA polymerase sigma-70 factor (ECF subfamily)